MPARNERSSATAVDEARTIVATRVFDAPRELVWKAWTDPQHIARWWGPKGFSNTIHQMDVRPGGAWTFIMHGPDGTDYQNKIVYREIVKPERIAYSHVSGPLFEALATFETLGNKTSVTVRMEFESAELRNRVAEEFGAVEGLQQTLGRLVDELAAMSLPGSADSDFVFSRTFDAPRDLMWKAWTEPERLAQWFGPKGVTIFHSKNDLRPSGVYHYGMRTPDGNEMWGKWTYREIVKPERLVFVVSFSDAKGGVTRHPFAADWPLETLSTVTFAENKGRTTVTVRWAALNATERERKTFDAGRQGMNQGWTGTFDQLGEYLSKHAENTRPAAATAGATPEVTITRVFDAPRPVVFKAWTDAKQMARWWGPHRFTNPVCELDARPGGAIRIDMRGPDGVIYPNRGVVHEIVEPERFVFSTTLLDDHGKVLIEARNTVTFAEHGGRTKVTLNARVTRSAPEAARYLDGMKEGWTQSLERLQQSLANH